MLAGAFIATGTAFATLGNVVGGTLLVAAIHRFVYLRGGETGEGTRG